MDKAEIIRRCGLTPKDGGYKVPEMQSVCNQLGINPKQKVADLRKSVIDKLSGEEKKELFQIYLPKKEILVILQWKN